MTEQHALIRRPAPALSLRRFLQPDLQVEVRREEIPVVGLLPIDAGVRFPELLSHDFQRSFDPGPTDAINPTR